MLVEILSVGYWVDIGCIDGLYLFDQLENIVEVVLCVESFGFVDFNMGEMSDMLNLF